MTQTIIVPSTPIIAPQGETRTPKVFQARIIANLCELLLSPAHPPCLLRSPTGSGKTFMLTRALQQVCNQQPTLWLWFVPFVNLVAQTVDSIDSEGVGLAAVQIANALNEEPAAGLVLISTVQGVASAKDRKTGYSGNEDDDKRSLAAYVQRARAAGLSIGCVVDEAHIALKTTTEFGQFVQWLKADYLLMASATPRDERLSQFIISAGYSHFESFSVSRADVVKERLNKAWIETVVYDLRASMQSVTDLKMTVLRRAWRRNQAIERGLRANGLTTVPLLLVQVGNGDEAIGEAQDFLMRELNVPAHAIGIHSADDPDPVMMAAIANDNTKQALIFKQSAGTGFDAPRAFVLASTKPVNDADFATQFIGRVMRVAPELQRHFPNPNTAPPELDTAYVFLANADAQAGFAQAADAIKAVKTELEGQTEELHARRTARGGVALTNRPTDQVPLTYDLGAIPTRSAAGEVLQPESRASDPRQLSTLPHGATGGLFDDFADDAQDLDKLLDEATEPLTTHDAVPVNRGRPAAPAARKLPSNSDELVAAFSEAGIRSIRRRTDLAIPSQFVTETRPVFDVLALDVDAAVEQLPLEPVLTGHAVKAALNRMTEKEIYTELFTGAQHEQDVQVVTDTYALVETTLNKLQGLGLEEQGAIDAVAALANRMLDAVEQAWGMQDDVEPPKPGALRSKARQAACWVLHKRLTEFQEILYQQWAKRATESKAAPLPDALLLPARVPVQPSRKNSYGILFPAAGTVVTAREALRPEARNYYETNVFVLSPDLYSVAAIDATYELNEQEMLFAKALDRADFVTWWHRNPQGKPSSVALMRSDSQKMFYPDFVVCMEHLAGEAPLMRLVDPKHDTKDASRKSQHVSSFYGKVLFLTKDSDRFKVVNDDGSVGEVVDFDDLDQLKIWMRKTAPRHSESTSFQN